MILIIQIAILAILLMISNYCFMVYNTISFVDLVKRRHSLEEKVRG